MKKYKKVELVFSCGNEIFYDSGYLINEDKKCIEIYPADNLQVDVRGKDFITKKELKQSFDEDASYIIFKVDDEKFESETGYNVTINK